MKVIIDQDKCIGCGACAATCPEVFKMGSDGKSHVQASADLEKNKASLREAIAGCPAGAIAITEG